LAAVNDPAQLRRLVEEAEKTVADMRARRDAASTPAERKEVTERLERCEWLLLKVKAREEISEIKRDTFILDVQRDLEDL
jgi:hypothetical protein